MTPEDLPLAGLRVVALEQAVSAPFATRQLADLGADVIKIERPDGGDIARGYDSVMRGESAYFAWLNRGKRSVVLDLKIGGDRNFCLELIGDADVFVHNLAPAAIDRLGLGYAELSATNERLIWCGISGYGADGPQRDRKAYDMLVQGESGVVALTGTPSAPAKVGISMADISSGLYAHASTLAALIQRGKTGRGQRIDISMLECLTEWVTPPIYVWQGSGKEPGRAGLRHNMIVPYGAYRCQDGQVMLAIQSEREWRRFANLVMGTSALADDARFATNALRLANRGMLEEAIERRFAGLSVEAATQLLENAEIPTGVVNDIAAVVRHPQLAARGRWTTVATPSGEIPALIPPHNLSDAPPAMGRVPALGEHGAQVRAKPWPSRRFGV